VRYLLLDPWMEGGGALGMADWAGREDWRANEVEGNVHGAGDGVGVSANTYSPPFLAAPAE
jgi:hypothetical protein